MKGFLLGVSLVCCLLLASGCAPIQTNVGELLDAPRLTETQGQVLEALRDEVGQNIKLKYPKSGDYRSAFTFYDIDGDGGDEAIVLYAIEEGGKATTRVVVLDNEDGRWKAAGGSGKHIAGLGPDVDFLRFEQMKQGTGKSLIIGWIPEGGEKIAAIYKYEDNNFSMEYSEDYTQIGIRDFSGTGCSQLLLIAAPDTGAQPYVILAGETEDGLIDTLDEVLLDDRVVAYLEPVCGVVSPGISGVVVDGYVRQDTLCTTIIQVIGDRLSIPTAENDNQLFFRTYRTTGVRSEDIDGDGVIEIPLPALPDGQEAVEQDSRIFYTDYARLNNLSFETVARAYVSTEQGYRMLFPDAWRESDPPVTVARLQENGEVIFFLPGKQAGDTPEELLRLRVGDSQGYPDKLETKSYFVVQQRGAFNYYAWLPAGAPPDLALSKEELSRLFTLIS